MNNELPYLMLVAAISSLTGLGLFSLMSELSPVTAAFFSSMIAGIVTMVVMTMPSIDWRAR